MPRCCIDKFINRNNTPLVTLISTNTAKNQKYESARQTSFANTRTWLQWLGNRGTTAHQACVMRDNSLSWREPNLKPESHMLEISVEACEDDQNWWKSNHRFLCFLKAETSVFTQGLMSLNISCYCWSLLETNKTSKIDFLHRFLRFLLDLHFMNLECS